jgi:hypothetical protein
MSLRPADSLLLLRALPPPWTTRAPREAVQPQRRRAASAARTAHAATVAEEGDLVFYQSSEGAVLSAGVVVGAMCSFRFVLPSELCLTGGLLSVSEPREDSQPVQVCVDEGAGLLAVLPASQRHDAASLQRAYAAALASA